MSLELRKAEAVVAAIIEERQALPVEMLIGEDQRRVSVEEHKQFREAITTRPHVGEIDLLVAEIREAESNKKGIDL
jgi:hypothetical protein